VRTDRSAERGFILATTLLVMTLLTVMLAAIFITVSAEFRSTGSSYSLARSLNLAQSGLYTYFASSHALGTGYDSTNITLPGGYTRVVARRLRDTTASARELWIVYATGVDTTRTLLSVGGGSRTVSTLAYRPGQIPARAAMVAANGVNVTANGANPLNGANAGIGRNWVLGCVDPLPLSPAHDTAALTTGPGGYSQSAGTNPNGTVQTLGSTAAVTDSTRIDWPRVLAGDFLPDHTGVLPPDCFGTSAVCPYDSYYITGDITIPASGFGTSRRGLLIATGDVTMANNSHWDGVIVAGGKVVDNVNNYVVHGMVISGMNCAVGNCPGPSLLKRRANSTVQWDWCYAHAAISGFSSLAPISGTFMDTWKTY
jgi:hypothetical protein